MTFKYSICHTEKQEIEYRNDPISGKEAFKIAKNYPWVEKLQLRESLGFNEAYYDPSLDFVCIENGISLGLSAYYDKKKNLYFSLWSNRPKTVKLLFGLLGKTERMVLDDVFGLTFDEAIYYFEYFIHGIYPTVEALYRKT